MSNNPSPKTEAGTADLLPFEREKGSVEILCREIGFRFSRAMESPAVLVAFVARLVEHIADKRQIQESLAEHIGGKRPSDGSRTVLEMVRHLLGEGGSPSSMIAGAAAIHAKVDELNPEDAYPTDHLIDMLSSCASVLRFGLETPCHSRHAAEAAGHIWKYVYDINLFDEHTTPWQHEWTRAVLQDAILSLSIVAPQLAERATRDELLAEMLVALEQMTIWMPSGFAPASQDKAMSLAYAAIKKAKAFLKARATGGG